MTRQVATDLPYDLTRLARWCVGLLTAIIALEVLYGLSMVYSLYEVNLARDGKTVETITFLDDFYWRSDLAVMGAALPYTLVSVAALISNGIWIYRASANAAAIDPSDKRIRPGWAVGWFFVPIANLFLPYRAMKETWSSTFDHRADVPGWMSLWWGLWVISGILALISLGMAADTSDLDRFATSNTLDIFISGLGVMVAIYFRRIVREVSAAQSLSRQRLAKVFA